MPKTSRDSSSGALIFHHNEDEKEHVKLLREHRILKEQMKAMDANFRGLVQEMILMNNDVRRMASLLEQCLDRLKGDTSWQ